MGQQLSQLGLSSSAASGDKKIFSDNASTEKNTEVKPFSSTLNEQLEKPSEVQSKKKGASELKDEANVHDKSEASTEDDTTVKAEAGTEESGNSLPSDTETADTEQAVLLFGEGEAKAEKVAVRTGGNSDNETKIVDETNDTEDTAVTTIGGFTAVSQPVKQTSSENQNQKATVKVKETGISTTGNTGAQQVDAASKLSENDEVMEESGTVSKPILRSDILHAIIKKQEPEAGKQNVVISKDTVIKGEQQLELPVSERQKMTQMLSASKSEGLALQAAQERVSNSFSSTLSSSTTLASAVTSSSTLAPQTSSVGQSVLTMQPSIQSEAWGKVLSSRVVWMAREGVQKAELRLNPANLGPVEVKLNMNNEQASVAFVAHNAATRDALEQALPRLKESFQENGMNLANADVSEQASEQQSGEQGSDEASSNSQGITHQEDENSHDMELEQSPLNSDELELGVSVFA